MNTFTFCVFGNMVLSKFVVVHLFIELAVTS